MPCTNNSFTTPIITCRPSTPTLLQVNSTLINYLSTSSSFLWSIALLENIAICDASPYLNQYHEHTYFLSNHRHIYQHRSIASSTTIPPTNYVFTSYFSHPERYDGRDLSIHSYFCLILFPSPFFILIYLLSDLTSFMLSLLSFVFLPNPYIRCTFFVCSQLISAFSLYQTFIHTYIYNLSHGPLFFGQGCQSSSFSASVIFARLLSRGFSCFSRCMLIYLIFREILFIYCCHHRLSCEPSMYLSLSLLKQNEYMFIVHSALLMLIS